MGPFGSDVGRDLQKEAPGHENTSSTIAFGQRARKLESGLATACNTLRQIDELKSEQERSLRKTQPGRNQQFGEERIPGAITIAGAGALSAVDRQTAKSDVAEEAVILERDEADLGSPGGALEGIVARHDPDTPGTVTLPPDVAMSERAGRDKTLRLRPPIELLQRGNAAIPGCGGDARAGVLAPPRAMEGVDIRARGGPYRLAACRLQESDPHRDVIAVRTQRMRRAHAIQRQVEEETVEIGIIGDAVAQDDRDVVVPTICCSAFLD